ncbi:GntR family transcriptional regulator [Lapidilactobacillus wuchangensis]|uniref:GntR family transcriptional regulator n=1 Tax=Lapidilactobacillus wuchangensis TaxID=2486001 RepID=UPI0013DE5495|nr:GntR family transcriptional regulator [Lapidilactobacillus wuchangensis]
MQIYLELKRRINQGIYPIGTMIPIEKNLIVEFNVSRITIQKAIKLLVDDNLVERKSGVGTFVLHIEKEVAANKTIGLIIPGLLPSFGENLLSSIEAECTKQGYYLLLKISHESQTLEKACTQELLDFPVDGLLIEPVQKKFYNPLLIKKILSGFPIVVLDKELAGIDSLFVSTDHYDGALKSANYLLQHRQHNIGIITYRSITNSSLEKRINAFREAYANDSISLTDSNIARVVDSYYLNPDISTGSNSDVANIKRYILKKKPTCLVVLDSYLGMLTKKAIDDLGLKIPQDISLFGFDSNKIENYAPEYTFLSQSEQELGKESVSLLIESLNQTVKQKRILIPANIQECHSVSFL